MTMRTQTRYRYVALSYEQQKAAQEVELISCQPRYYEEKVLSSRLS